MGIRISVHATTDITCDCSPIYTEWGTNFAGGNGWREIATIAIDAILPEPVRAPRVDKSICTTGGGRCITTGTI